MITPYPSAPGTGTVTEVSSANGAATVATGTSTPVITINSAPILTTARTIGGTSFNGSANITVASATGGFTVTGGALTLTDQNIVLSASTGTQIGTATSQKLAFWGTAPAAQQVLATGAGKTADNIITFLQSIGLCKQS